ncbi:glutathionylspermidine synthase family protein [Pontibacter cellulosilyticus]|uniref:Glutathionylspermidine synthase family protein n=1 Tax=Pontibacter cellulosilyticus TaxID=1720253 RepID=A0A923SIB1_9BACT|nr:glutathionylspermidine synthase family protein [Pontibacter cellulosilyticus]MBC5992619.1 glutathionylspermidine synthase family protein [Pontibacter cellulosilyticus]
MLDKGKSQVRLTSHTGDVETAVRGLGWEWCVEDGCANYVPGEAVVLTEKEAEALLEAADTLYGMMVQAVPENLPDEFLKILGIPENLWELLRQSWNDDRHWHLYGRFDLAQTPDGPKLLEFNADTATSIPETAVVQWASLAAAGKNDANQYSGLYEALVEQLKSWRMLNDDLAPALLVTYLGASAEDQANCAVIAQAASEAGFDAHLCPIEDVSISTEGAEKGVWAQVGAEQWRQFPFLFKLLPWEQIAWEEPELLKSLTYLASMRNVIIANPAYTLLFQSKGMLAWLWKAYPYHPLLLETDLEPLNCKYIRKPYFGREGQSVEVVDKVRITKVEGEYDKQQQVYQRWCDLPEDSNGYQYQAGVFWAGEGCAIGFRREKGIITNLSQFVPHLVE